MSGTSDKELPAFVLRLTRRVTAEVQDSWEHFVEAAGETIADQWQQGLETAIATLATLPERHAILENESELLGFSVRRLLYRRTSGSPAYHIYYRVVIIPDDAPTVQIIHVRHGSRAPLDSDEAQLILNSLP